MRDPKLIKKIEEFVYPKPRSIQEIAAHIQKNWRTADRYITDIEKEYGTLATRVFREGTRGALKIVYWASIENINHSVFQEQLEKEILTGRTKEDFSPFDIFQHIPDKKKHSYIKKGTTETTGGLEKLKELILSAKKQMLIFSGNLSFINFTDSKINTFSLLETQIKKGISMKILSRVDIGGKENIEKLLSLNFKTGKELITIRHRAQPLRAILIDNTLFNIKETLEPTGRTHELKTKTYLFYTIQDKEWVEWLTRIFWHMYTSSIDAHKRLEEIKKLPHL